MILKTLRSTVVMEGIATAVRVVCFTLLCFSIATGLGQINANILREYSEKGMR